NQFHDYNVGTQGVILNNVANQTGATQLGGIIIGNPNLTNRVAAQTILNEVVGGSPSQLRGYTEVAGQSARVIVANPYGISCNGCGFINTPRVTLTTGKPVLDNGRLDRFQVDQGSVAIDGAGLNANNVDRFEIITRSAKINAEIQARNLTIITGRNDVNADSLNATARADDGSAKPQLAIDSSAFGGMYAGAIKLVGTEAGVGVKLDGNLAASGGDIQLDANGHLSLAQTSATGAVNVKAASLDAQGPVYAGTVNIQTQGNLSNQQTLAARDSITLSAGGVLTNNGVIEAGVNADTSRNANGDVSLSAQNLNNTGKTVVANPRFLPCGDASCVASGAGIDLKDPETQRWISAGNTKAAKDALAVGSLVPLPMAWVGKVLGSVFGKGVASEAIGGGSSAVAKGLGEVGGAKGVGAVDVPAISTLPKSFNESVLGHNTQIGVRNSKAGTISGAHNNDAFLESVEMTGAKVSNKITDVRFPGVVEYSYQLPRANTKGELIGGYKPISTKTTYDPKVLPDSKVADMSSRAAVQAETVFNTNPALREASIQVDGYYFQVTRNSKTGEITNSFITMPPRRN
ncbi:filamentous hemagglutinin N-terminal domain-containing protein, partial [Pseudomonas lini]|uniref:two-partner secretion domain-containing protein n=1 Tax=Pseudomonas lini TaxID=163011 RepID=UPI002905698A